jgi:hypothetical protein
MKDRYAETAVGIDVGVVEWSNELEVWRAVRVIFGERQPRLKVATIVQRVRIQDDESDTPFKEVVVD